MTSSSDCTLYSYYRSSCSERVRIALYLKNIIFNYVAVHLLKDGGEQYGPEYKKQNPLAQVPCLVHQGRVISQSLAVIQYLDDIKPEPLLFPKEPELKAYVLEVCEMINSGLQPLQNLAVLNYLKNTGGFSKEQTTQWVGFWMQKVLAGVEGMIQKKPGPWAAGKEVSAADLFIVPQLYSARRWKVNLKSYPRLLEVEKSAGFMAAFQKAHPDQQPDSPCESKPGADGAKTAQKRCKGASENKKNE